MPAYLVVALKELKDAFRDRRAVLALLLFPIMGPAMIYFMLNSIIDIGEESQTIELPVVGMHNSIDLIDYFQQNGLIIKEVKVDESLSLYSPETMAQIKHSIDNREYDFALIIPEDFTEKMGQSSPVNLELHHDSSRTKSSPKVRRVEGLIRGWSSETVALRLMLRGISTEVVNPVNLNTIDVASAQARARAILMMIPMFVIMAAFVSGMGVAVDATAGERERKSLEPLLVNPVARHSIVMGKWLAAIVFSVVGLIIVMSLNLFALSSVPLEQMGVSFNIGVPEIVGILLATLPLAFFATSIQVFVGIFAKSFKDAQAYLSLIVMLPMLPYFYNIFNTSGREFWMNFVPMLGQNMLLTDVIGGKTPATLDFVLSGLTVLVCSLIFISLAAKLFKRERVIFN